MKLRREDQVIVIAGRDRGKTGKVLAVIPADNKVVVENINVVKRHTKPGGKFPRGGILDITKPISASKVMVLDPTSGKPARIGFATSPDGTKQRIFKVSPNQKKSKAAKEVKKSETKAPAKAAKKTTGDKK